MVFDTIKICCKIPIDFRHPDISMHETQRPGQPGSKEVAQLISSLLFAELLQISSSFPTVISYPLVAFGEGSALFLPFSDEERSVPGLLLWPSL